MTLAPIAIVGIATELPSGEHSSSNLGHDEFYSFLMSKKDSYTRIPKERFNIDAWKGRGLGQTIAERGSFLKDVGMFDPTEFGVTAKDARAMAVSARKLIELSFLALLDSGIDYRGRNVGCYASATAFDMLTMAEPDEMEPKGSVAGIPCMIANKISYHLDLRGPSIPIDTACSSTGVALHLAVQAIRRGEIESAVVAGCQLNLRASDFALYTQGSILAPDGRCKPFDAGGNGFSRGEGAAVIIVKPLDQAVKDGDYIYGSVLGTGVSSCGSIAPVNAPVAEAQADAMERAYFGTGRHPNEVDFVEVHGTGTAAGDPAEANWVGEKFSRPGELLIGSVKGNTGHLEISSFLVSMSKVCSIFDNLRVPPNVHLKTRNPRIRWEDYRLRVPLEPEPITARSPSGNLLISICSSGIGGVNAHAVLESHPNRAHTPCGFAGPVLFIGAGLSPRSASAVSDQMRNHLAKRPDTIVESSILYGRRSRPLTWRTFAVKRPGEDLASFTSPILSPRNKIPVVLLFSGQGPQHINMGRQLFEAYPVFRRSILDLDACYIKRTGTSLIKDIGLFGASNGHQLPNVWPISLILPSITAVQLALFDLLVSFGLRPDVLIGHSAGETALLYASGAGSKEMALEISIARGEAMTIVEEESEGTMAALACSADDAYRIIRSVSAKHPGKTIEIACFNSPDAVALSGHTVLIDEAVALATKGGFMARKIMTRVPVHGSLMELCEKQFKSLVADVFSRYPGEHRTKVTTYSTCTGQILDCFTAEYFWNNTRNAVLFTKAMETLVTKYPNPLFVEMSAHPVLSSYVSELGVPASSIVGPMRRSKVLAPHQEQTTLLTAIGQLIIGGYNRINFNSLNGLASSATAPRASLPPYPFAKKFVTYYPELSRVMYRQMNPKNGPLNFPDLRVNVATHPELADHLINSEPIMPAAGFIEMGLEFGAKTMWNIKFHSILALSADSPIPVEVQVDGMYYSVKSHGPVTNFFNHDPKSLRLHADGYFSRDVAVAPSDLDIESIRGRCTSFNVQAFYDTLKYFAQYGPSFRRVDQISLGQRDALVRIRGLESDLAGDNNYVIHPAILDATFHACVHPSMTKSTDPNVYFLPSRVNTLNVYDSMSREAMEAGHVYAHIEFQSWSPSELVYDIALVDMDGRHLFRLQGFVVARHLQVPVLGVDARYELIYQPWGLPQRQVYLSSNSSDSGILIDTPKGMSPAMSQSDLASDFVSVNSDLGSEPKALGNCCQDVLRYIVDSCEKKVIRVLELQSEGYFICGKQVVETLEQYGAVCPTYTVVSPDVKSISSSSLPQQFTSVEGSIGNEDVIVKLDPGSFDVIIGSVKPESCKTFNYLRSLLVPGGFLLGSGLSSAATTTVHSAGFKDITTISESNVTQAVHIHTQSPSLPSVLPSISRTATLIIHYAVRREMSVQRQLRALGDTFDQPIWLIAFEGVDADSLAGFGRTLTKEFPQWNIRIVSFPRIFSVADCALVIDNYLPQRGIEREFVVKENLCITVPRIVRAAPPSNMASSPEADLASLHEEEILVDVGDAHRSDTGLWGMVGTVSGVHGNRDSHLLGKEVVAVTIDVPSTKTRVHCSCVAHLPPIGDRSSIAASAPALFFGGAMLGIAILKNPTRLRSRLVITHANEEIGACLVALCQMLNLRYVTLQSTFTPQEIFALKLQSDDVILTGADTSDTILTSLVPETAKYISWVAKGDIHASIKRDPWGVHDVLDAIMRLPKCSGLLPLAPLFAKVPSAGPTTSPLFSADKSYLLIGGMGSLGPYVALWMYNNGARHVVLTSRSGRRTLDKMADSLPARVFHYVESISDFNLSVKGADASNAMEMRSLLRDLKKPLGGCILLAATFDDRLFYAQDQDSFTRSFASKIGAVETLEKLVDLAMLDFVISMSSITIWGNAGQTNYTSANTALDGKLKPYRNAFSIASPAIFDTTSMSGTISTSDAQRASHLTASACSPQELCNYLEDGLRKLADGPFHVYVPPYDFSLLEETLGSSHLYSYMARRDDQQDPAATGEDLYDIIRSLVLQFIDISPEDFSPDVPFTTYGLDSLSAGRLSFALRPWIVLSQMQLLGDMRLVDLEDRIVKTRVASTNETSGELGSSMDVSAGAAEIDRMIEKYSLGFDADAKRHNGPLIPHATVLITGTTGGLGSYFLARLLNDPHVACVYAFNRPSSASSSLERQTRAFEERGLDTSMLASKKLVFVEGQAAENNLGVDQKLYDSMRNNVSVIIDNAWRLDLNSPLKTFTSNIAATRNLIDLALASSHVASIRYAFISSNASAQGWADLSKEVPEDIITDSRLAVLRGYGESKYISERLVNMSGLQSSVFRVGQLCGATDMGVWTTTEWVPMLVKSGLRLNALPDAGGVVTWLPMDKVAPIVMEVVFDPQHPPEVLNVVHPRPVSFHSVMNKVEHELSAARGNGQRIPLIPFAEWNSALENLGRSVSVEESQDLPALKLIDRFHIYADGCPPLSNDSAQTETRESGGWPKLALGRILSSSATMRSMLEASEEIGIRHVKAWINYWQEQKFLNL